MVQGRQLAGPLHVLRLLSPRLLLVEARRNLKCVLNPVHFRNLAIFENHFRDIEAIDDVRSIQSPEPGTRPANDKPLLLSVYRACRTAKLPAGTCFHLHEDQEVAMAADQVDLTSMFGPVIPPKHLPTVAKCPARRQSLAELPNFTPGQRTGSAQPATPPQMAGRAERPVQTFGDELDKAHGAATGSSAPWSGSLCVSQTHTPGRILPTPS